MQFVLLRQGKQLNAVRVGDTLYGVCPIDEESWPQFGLLPILRWDSYLSLVKTVPAGTQVGYGGTFTAQRVTRVATVPVGYADGYRRCLGGRFHVLIGGCAAPILGRGCMDQMMVDVTDIPGVQADDPVVLIGRQGAREITAEQMAQAAETIPYEILSLISRRMPRVYTRGGETVKVVHYLPEE